MRSASDSAGGTHVPQTGMIGVIAVAGWERFKGATRLTFVCGGRALRAHAALRDVVVATTRALSVLAGELPAAVVKLQVLIVETDRLLMPPHRAVDVAQQFDWLRGSRVQGVGFASVPQRGGEVAVAAASVGFGALQVGYDNVGWAIWQKEGQLFKVANNDPIPTTSADIVKPMDPPWPYPWTD